jgi:hypothetical protein
MAHFSRFGMAHQEKSGNPVRMGGNGIEKIETNVKDKTK